MFPVEEPLELSTSKSDGIFADQTPTPTGLYKNCEEFGIFEDLKHVNPFEEIFRHAVEEKSGQITNLNANKTVTQINDEESLHTPQVFPAIEPPNSAELKTNAITRTQSSNSDLTTPTTTTPSISNNEFSVKVTTEEPPAKKYRPIAEKSIPQQQHATTASALLATTTTTTGTAIPIQTVKPLILTKLNAGQLKPTLASQTSVCTVTSPSSASLTPTSQLPIKERLKVILNNNKSQRSMVCNAQTPQKLGPTTKKSRDQLPVKYDERCLERRRAAATRYRTKMRNEHKELRRLNNDLQNENTRLRERILELERQLKTEKTSKITSSTPQFQIPASSIHLVMNIPKLVVPVSGAPLLENAITYSVEKK